MAEKVLPEALSGLEVRTAILDKIARALERDCHLHDQAYQFFEAHVTISLKVHDIGRVESVEINQRVTGGENTDNEFLDAAEAEFDIKAQSPNEVRVETGQLVPVLTRDKDGNPEIKGIRYAREHAKK